MKPADLRAAGSSPWPQEAPTTQAYREPRRVFVSRAMVITSQLNVVLDMPQNAALLARWDDLQLRFRHYNLLANEIGPIPQRLKFARSLVAYFDAENCWRGTEMDNWRADLLELSGWPFERTHSQAGNVLLEQVGPLVRAIMNAPPPAFFRLRLIPPLRRRSRRAAQDRRPDHTGPPDPRH